MTGLFLKMAPGSKIAVPVSKRSLMASSIELNKPLNWVLAKDDTSGEVRLQPTRTEIIILVPWTQNVIGEKNSGFRN